MAYIVGKWAFMVEKFLQTDEREDLLASLKVLNLALAQAEKDLSFWKWAVIATHNALQSAMVCHLGSKGTYSLGKMTLRNILLKKLVLRTQTIWIHFYAISRK